MRRLLLYDHHIIIYIIVIFIFVMIITLQKITVNVVLFCDIKDSSPDTGISSSPSGYDPHLLDDPELTSGRHRKVLNLASYLVSTCDTQRNYLLKLPKLT